MAVTAGAHQTPTWTGALLRLVLAACAVALFLGGLLADIAYARSYQVQWTNFAAWLIAGAMVFTGLALAWSVIDLVLAGFRRRGPVIEALLWVAAFVVGLLDSFTHARDAWGAMPWGLVLSIVVTALAVAATWIGVPARGEGARP